MILIGIIIILLLGGVILLLAAIATNLPQVQEEEPWVSPMDWDGLDERTKDLPTKY